jgi:hypothetical protein
MKYEDVQDYILLQDMFQARCEEVCGLLISLNCSYGYLSDFEITNNEVWGEGDEYLGYGESEYHSAKFPSSFLWKDNAEIKQYVEDELNKRREAEESKRLEIQKLLKEVQERKDREEYERLKKKFG